LPEAGIRRRCQKLGSCHPTSTINFSDWSSAAQRKQSATWNSGVPVKPQADFFGHAGVRNGLAASLRRQDDGEQQAVDETVAAVQSSSRLLDRVAVAMATSPNLAAELLKIEEDERVDTHPARRFIYRKQEDFIVEVEDEEIPFNAHVVRVAVVDHDPVNVVMTPVESRSESTVVRGLINVTQGKGGSDVIQLGGIHEFRFIGLEGWKKAVLEAARWLKLPICLVAVETVSTCTLLHRPSDVLQVHNWHDLLANTLVALLSIRDAQSGGRVQELRDVA